MTLAWIRLDSGRGIQLTSLEIFSTYGGLLVGHPCARVNDRLLARLAVREPDGGSLPVHVVTPPRRYPEGASGRPPLGPVEELPSVYCRADFRSRCLDEELDDGFRESGLTVVWFQDDLASPVADFVTAGVAGLVWEELAEDYEL